MPGYNIWSKEGNQGPKWKFAQVTVTTDGLHRIIFEGTVGNGYEGDIALDDISFKQGNCSLAHMITSVASGIVTSTVPTTTMQVLLGQGCYGDPCIQTNVDHPLARMGQRVKTVLISLFATALMDILGIYVIDMSTIVLAIRVKIMAAAGMSILRTHASVHSDFQDRIVLKSCYVDTFLDGDGSVRYHAGCRPSSNCMPSTGDNCTHCCDSDYCNDNGCGLTGYHPASQRGPICFDCDDMTDMAFCKQITQCAPDEMCTVYGSPSMNYDSKCISKNNQCDTQGGNGFCQFCCFHDMCNQNCTKH
ncbi:hypothetical protein DPMN_087388 [Dreissena polymorpha]|uniref:MAM domain-containing protein n=1 Tax=Dreissena polymorpha TaxID=45954 RepID=A0A9D4QWB6_DREPO|nr:hypothetical protein DPMN_087388 [Dreissena polymorpha]